MHKKAASGRLFRMGRAETMIKAGIVGGTGYTGVELLRLLAQHPQVEIAAITSRKEAGTPVAAMFPSLRGRVALAFSEPENAKLGDCDVVFFATPNGVAMGEARALLERDVRVVDLSADFRIRDVAQWERWYKMKHAAPELLGEAVYGLCEVHRERIRGARLVANPGCYPTATQLGFLPLVEAGVVDLDYLIADAKSGVSGAGRKNPNLLFAGTEFGAFFSIDGGKKWIQLKGGLPTVAVRDMVIQAREKDLVLATFGRGVYILDDITPLRQMKAETLQQESALFPVKDPLLYVQRVPLGWVNNGFQGDTYYSAANPPFGATFTYYLKEKLKNKKEQRQETEKKAEKDGKPITYPTNDQLRAEAEAPKPEVYFMVYDESGAPIRRVPGDLGEGFHRTSWDLRYFAPSITESEAEFSFASAGSMGPLVLPGKYSVRLFKRVDGTVTELAGPQSFTVVADGRSELSPADRAVQEEFQRKVSRLYRAVSGAINTADDVDARLKQIRKALADTPSADSLTAAADAIQQRNNEILRALRGDIALAARSENVPTSINDRVNSIMEGERFAIARPTQTHMDGYAIAADEFAQQLSKLRSLIQVDLAKLEKDMEAAGAPWTPGRLPEWQ